MNRISTRGGWNHNGNHEYLPKANGGRFVEIHDSVFNRISRTVIMLRWGIKPKEHKYEASGFNLFDKSKINYPNYML